MKSFWPTPSDRSHAAFTEEDGYLFAEGNHWRLYEKLGAHLATIGGVQGTLFAVWAPNASSVSVIGEFDGWDHGVHPMQRRGPNGIWERFIPGVVAGARYKYHVVAEDRGYAMDKADPFGFWTEEPPSNASVVVDLEYRWSDGTWMHDRADKNRIEAPISIYELHIGSWRREHGRFLTYRELAPLLASYVKDLGFTHVELLPIMEHPFYGSWGYQTTGYFAATRRYGTPQDLMFLVDHLHRHGIGVILDWVPAHFPDDGHGLSYFDGTHLFEHQDPRQGFHPEWKSLIFNYGRPEVRSFLLSSALFWLDRYHADGIRVDGVASMLYLDYAREPGQWIPNRLGGRENLEAVDLLRRLNEAVAQDHPDVVMIAEESTSWPMVSRPTAIGGLGFTMKWDMGWMHDVLGYLGHDPIHRRYHHTEVTFRSMYAYSESFVLPLSHDEVVYGKRSLIRKMHGDDWQRRANLRLLFGNLFAQPGKKLLFMGDEFAQEKEWNHDVELDWPLGDDVGREGIVRWVRDLNRFYVQEPAMYEGDCVAGGFEWVDGSDIDNSVLTWLRHPTRGRSPGTQGADPKRSLVLVVFNFTPLPRYEYGVGVPRGGLWQEVLNSDATGYGGSGIGNLGGAVAESVEVHGRPFKLLLTVPPLGVLFLRSLPSVVRARVAGS